MELASKKACPSHWVPKLSFCPGRIFTGSLVTVSISSAKVTVYAPKYPSCFCWADKSNIWLLTRSIMALCRRNSGPFLHTAGNKNPHP